MIEKVNIEFAGALKAQWQKELKSLSNSDAFASNAFSRLQNTTSITPPIAKQDMPSLRAISTQLCNKSEEFLKNIIRISNSDFQKAYQLYLINKLDLGLEIANIWLSQNPNRIRKNRPE